MGNTEEKISKLEDRPTVKTKHRNKHRLGKKKTQILGIYITISRGLKYTCNWRPRKKAERDKNIYKFDKNP